MAKRADRSRVDEVADELYGLPLDRFTATRNERARQSKQDGDAAAATAIGKLGKPNASAWLANQLVRRHRDEVTALLELGGSMRAATANLNAGELRELSKQQHRVVHALVQQARDVAADAGQSVSESTARGLEDTLHAALADEQAGEQLAAGRLTTTLTRSGFPGAETSSAAAGRPRGAHGRKAAPDRTHKSTAKDAERGARADADAARTALDEAKDELARADQAVQDAAAEVDRLRGELDAAREKRMRAEREQRAARSAADRAERAFERAKRAVDNPAGSRARR